MDLYDFLWSQCLSDPVVCVRCSCFRWFTYWISIFHTRSRSTSKYCVLKDENNGCRCVKTHVLSFSTLLLCIINWAMWNLAHSQLCDIMWPSESESGGDRQFAASFSWEFFIHTCSRVKPAHNWIPYRRLLSISVRFPFMDNFLINITYLWSQIKNHIFLLMCQVIAAWILFYFFFHSLSLFNIFILVSFVRSPLHSWAQSYNCAEQDLINFITKLRIDTLRVSLC